MAPLLHRAAIMKLWKSHRTRNSYLSGTSIIQKSTLKVI